MKKSKKILMATPFFYPHVGGSELYMEDLYINLLKEHPDISVDVLCYNTDNAPSVENSRHLTIYRLPCINILPGKYSLPNPFYLWNFFNTHRDYNLIHTSTRFFDLSWWCLIFGKFAGKKVILTDHCADTPTHSNIVVRLLANFIDSLSGKLSLRFYDKVFVVSHATKVYLKHCFGIQSKLLYAGVNIAFLSKPKKIQKDKLRIVYAGRMIAVKGVLELFEVASKIDGVETYFAGPGELVSMLQKKVKKNKLSNIHILGQITKSQLANLFKQSDIFVYPSYHPEGIPMALLEAGASGLAVIATTTGGMKEVIKDKQTGLLVGQKDKESLKLALEKLIRNQPLRKKLGRNLFSYVNKTFNWKKTSEAFYSEIREFLA